jgi:hypothetical protein
MMVEPVDVRTAVFPDMYYAVSVQAQRTVRSAVHSVVNGSVDAAVYWRVRGAVREELSP